jgi:hypothetical protein
MRRLRLFYSTIYFYQLSFSWVSQWSLAGLLFLICFFIGLENVFYTYQKIERFFLVKFFYLQD